MTKAGLIPFVFLASAALSGCATTFEKECLEHAPPGNWSAIPKPDANVPDEFDEPQEELPRQWFMDEAGFLALCVGCDRSSTRVSTFRSEGPDGDRIRVITCGPY